MIYDLIKDSISALKDLGPYFAAIVVWKVYSRGNEAARERARVALVTEILLTYSAAGSIAVTAEVFLLDIKEDKSPSVNHFRYVETLATPVFDKNPEWIGFFSNIDATFMYVFYQSCQKINSAANLILQFDDEHATDRASVSANRIVDLYGSMYGYLKNIDSHVFKEIESQRDIRELAESIARNGVAS
jgi:hypothetical protein